MGDLIQDGLRAWFEDGDREQGGDALDALAREWRPRVRRLLQSPGPDEVEEVLQEALVALCTFEKGKAPRALAPPDASSPAAWRGKVLTNHITDRGRRGGRRRHAERGLAAGLSPEAEAVAWRQDKQARKEGAANRPEPLSVRETAAPEPIHSADAAELALMRHDVLAQLPKLVIRRRVILMLALGGDPSPFARELASALDELEELVLSRVQEALVAEHDGGHEHLSLAMIRVVWPDEPEAKAREAARKNLERAVADLRALLVAKP